MQMKLYHVLSKPKISNCSIKRPYRWWWFRNCNGSRYENCKEKCRKLGLPEINLGVLAGTGGTARLTRLIGKAKALELMVTGELISFEDGDDMNLVNQIFDSDAEDFRRDVLDWAGQFTLPNKAVKAVGNIKRSVQSGIELPLEYHLALERELQSDLFQSNDAKEGIAAYVKTKLLTSLRMICYNLIL